MIRLPPLRGPSRPGSPAGRRSWRTCWLAWTRQPGTASRRLGRRWWWRPCSEWAARARPHSVSPSRTRRSGGACSPVCSSSTCTTTTTPPSTPGRPWTPPCATSARTPSRSRPMSTSARPSTAPSWPRVPGRGNASCRCLHTHFAGEAVSDGPSVAARPSVLGGLRVLVLSRSSQWSRRAEARRWAMPASRAACRWVEPPVVMRISTPPWMPANRDAASRSASRSGAISPLPCM